MRKRLVDLAVAVAAGLIVLVVTEATNLLRGWEVWVVSAAAALSTFVGLLFLVSREADASNGERRAYAFLSGISAKDGIELNDVEVDSSGPHAEHITNIRTGGSIRILGSRFGHSSDQQKK